MLLYLRMCVCGVRHEQNEAYKRHTLYPLPLIEFMSQAMQVVLLNKRI